jgi:hypothetical protein
MVLSTFVLTTRKHMYVSTCICDVTLRGMESEHLGRVVLRYWRKASWMNMSPKTCHFSTLIRKQESLYTGKALYSTD